MTTSPSEKRRALKRRAICCRSRLLKSARRWAIEHELAQLMLEIQTKNHPAISFAQKHGFQFCGYNERYYRNRDIALYFVRGL